MMSSLDSKSTNQTDHSKDPRSIDKIEQENNSTLKEGGGDESSSDGHSGSSSEDLEIA